MAKGFHTGGTPPHVPTAQTRKLVMRLVSYGIPQDYICEHVGCNTDTLLKHYKKELESGLHHANAKVAGKLFKKAVIDEDLSAIIFWLKTRGKWRTEDSKDDKKMSSLVEALIKKAVKG